jgi:hypothetical protein
MLPSGCDVLLVRRPGVPVTVKRNDVTGAVNLLCGSDGCYLEGLLAVQQNTTLQYRDHTESHTK